MSSDEPGGGGPTFQRVHPEVALLLHLADWELEAVSVTISPNIQLGLFAGSKIATLYGQLVSRDGIDQGERLNYGAYVLFRPSPDGGGLLDFSDSYSLVERFSNALVVATSHPLAWSRVIWSVTDFRSAEGTAQVHQAGPQADFVYQDPVGITESTVGTIRAVWATIDSLWKAEKAGGRINSALQYFYLAWRAHYLEQTCLHLAVAMEILFAPHSQGETTHQLAFNLSRFQGTDREDRERLYRLAKTFYGKRSSIIHGGLPDDASVIDVTVEMFHEMAALLRRILTSRELADTLNADTRRRALWAQYLFGQ